MKTELPFTQAVALHLATRRPDGRLDPRPQNIRGAARDSVIQRSLSRALIARCFYPGHDESHLTAAGLLAVGGPQAIDGSCD